MDFYLLLIWKTPVEALGRPTSTLESNKIWRREKMNILKGFVPYRMESVNINCAADLFKDTVPPLLQQLGGIMPIPGLNYCRHVLYYYSMEDCITRTSSYHTLTCKIKFIIAKLRRGKSNGFILHLPQDYDIGVSVTYQNICGQFMAAHLLQETVHI